MSFPILVSLEDEESVAGSDGETWWHESLQIVLFSIPKPFLYFMWEIFFNKTHQS